MSIQWHGRVASRKYGLPKLKPYSQTSDTSFAKKVASLVPVLCQVWKATRRASRLPHRWMHRERWVSPGMRAGGEEEGAPAQLGSRKSKRGGRGGGAGREGGRAAARESAVCKWYERAGKERESPFSPSPPPSGRGDGVSLSRAAPLLLARSSSPAVAANGGGRGHLDGLCQPHALRLARTRRAPGCDLRQGSPRELSRPPLTHSRGRGRPLLGQGGAAVCTAHPAAWHRSPWPPAVHA